MKKSIVRVLSLLVLASMVFSFAACSNASNPQESPVIMISQIFDPESPYAAALQNGGSSSQGNVSGGNSTAQPATPVNNNTDSTPASDSSATPASDSASTNTQTPASSGGSASTDQPASSGGNTSTDQPASSGSSLPSTPADILAKYTEVTKNTKAQLKTYNKKEWQTVTDLDLGAATSIVNGLIPQFMTKEEDAEVQNQDNPKNIPPEDAAVGCFLTDASAIKTATCEPDGDGFAKITIVLNDESNPEPAKDGSSPSKTGGIFPCMPKQAILDTLAGIKVITVNSFDLTYKDCTVVAKYDTANNRVVEMNYTMPVHITGSVKLLVNIDVTGTVTDFVIINNIAY